MTTRELADVVGISNSLVDTILKDGLAMRKCAKFVPKLLTIEQKKLCLEVTQDMLNSFTSYPDFMNIVIIGDES